MNAFSATVTLNTRTYSGCENPNSLSHNHTQMQEKHQSCYRSIRHHPEQG